MSIIEKVAVNGNDEPIPGARIATVINWTEGVEWNALNTKPIVDAILAALPGYLEADHPYSQTDVMRSIKGEPVQGEVRNPATVFLSLTSTDRRALVTQTVTANCHAQRTGQPAQDHGVGQLITDILDGNVEWAD